MTDFHFSGTPESQEMGDTFIGSGELFVMLFAPGLERLFQGLADKRIKRSDISLLILMFKFYNPRSGRCHVSLIHLSQELGLSRTGISESISRLKKELFIVTHVDKRDGARSFMIDPYLFCSGGKRKRALLAKTFMDLVNE